MEEKNTGCPWESRIYYLNWAWKFNYNFSIFVLVFILFMYEHSFNLLFYFYSSLFMILRCGYHALYSRSDENSLKNIQLLNSYNAKKTEKKSSVSCQEILYIVIKLFRLLSDSQLLWNIYVKLYFIFLFDIEYHWIPIYHKYPTQ